MNQRQFFAQVCVGMGWTPDEDRLDVFEFWAKQEGMPFERSWNPLATTWLSDDVALSTENIGFGAGNWNSVPVRLYATAEDGIRATVKTLSLSYYVNVRRCFADKAAYPEAIRPKDFTSWVGSDVYGKRIVDYMAERFSRPATAAPESSVREIAREEAEKMVGGLFLPLLMQVLELAPETFTDDKALAAIRAKLLAPAARVPAHTHSMNLIVTQTGGVQ